MKLDLEHKTLRRLLDRLKEGERHALQWAEAMGLRGDALSAAMEDEDALGEALQGTIDRFDPELAERVSRAVRGASTLKPDPVTRATLDHYGIPLMALVAICDWTMACVEMVDPDGTSLTFFHVQDRERTSVSLHLGDGIIWEMDDETPERKGQFEISDPLPETVRATLPGRPLRQLLSHPVFDGLNLVIAHVQDYAPNKSLIVEVILQESAA